MRLVELQPRGVSLELGPAEQKAVLHDVVASRGGRFEKGVTFDTVHVAGARIVVLDEWDEPCLIADDEAGASVLRAIAAGPARRIAAA